MTMTALTSTTSPAYSAFTTSMTALTAFITLTAFTTLMFSASAQAAQQANKLIDRYTVLNPIQTPAQADPLSVVISIKFAKSVVSVKQAIEQLLRQSGYTLSKNYDLEKIVTTNQN